MQNRILMGNAYSSASYALSTANPTDPPIISLTPLMAGFIFELQKHYGANVIHSPLSRYIIKNKQGFLFLNYLIPLIEGGEGNGTADQRNSLCNFKYQIVEKMNELTSSSSESLKIVWWFADYFNYFCKTFMNITNPRYLIGIKPRN